MPINNLEPTKRASLYCEDKVVLDLKGSRFPNAGGFFIPGNQACVTAFNMVADNKSPAVEFWLPVIRDCVLVGPDIKHIEYWSALSFMATLYLDIQRGEACPYSEEADGIAKDFITSLRKQDLSKAFKSRNLQEFFNAFFAFAGFQRGSNSQPAETLSWSLGAVDLAHACADLMNAAESEAFLSEVETKPYFEQLIVKSSHAVWFSKNPRELLVSPLLRACLLKYKGFPRETAFFAAYYQEAELRGGLDLCSNITEWINDVDAYSKAVASIKPKLVLEMIEERLEGMASAVELMKEIEVAVPSDDPVAWCEYYWCTTLGYDRFLEMNIISLDQILLLVDLIAWRNLTRAGFND